MNACVEALAVAILSWMPEEFQNTILQEMVRVGLHIGHRRSRRHPAMMPYVYGTRGNTEIIDVMKTAEALRQAADFLRAKAADGVTILLVGTRQGLTSLAREVARELGLPYVASRWIGGTITNFSVINKRLEAFRNLAQREASGELAEKYTKAERVRFQRQLGRLEEELGGIRDLLRPPDVLVLASLRGDRLAAREARLRRIPIVALADLDADPSLADFPIPGNDDALPAVRYVLGRLADAIREGQESHRARANAKVEGKEQEEGMATA